VRRLRCTFFLALCGIALSSNGARAGDMPEAPSRCQDSEIEIFSCVLHSQKVAAFCLQPDLTTLNYELLESKTRRTTVTLTNIKQGYYPYGGGYTTILRGETSNQVVTLFVDPGFHGQPTILALQTKNNGNIQTSFCIHSTFHAGLTSVSNGDTSRRIGLFSLKNLGITQPLSEEPRWPDGQ
jgi:hypothetical protein